MGDNELDLDLVKRAQHGDKTAFDLLVRKYQYRIAAVVSRYVADHAECQDVVQDSFIRAYRALSGFRGDSQFYTWLFRIAVNTAKNHLLALKRRPPDTDVDVGDAEHYAGNAGLVDADTPEHQLLRQEIERVVSETVDALPEELRQAFTLREVEGMSYDEIAQVMACPIGTVRSRIFRARDAIDSRLKPLLGSDRVRP